MRWTERTFDFSLPVPAAPVAGLGRVPPVLLDDAPPLLRFEIARDGVLLFQREDHLWTGFKARAMVDWWDWAPTHRRIASAVVRRLRERIADGQG
ncbi:MAG TPA: hypothetical protein DD490_26695 [Acidobacteria bacterium]|nr:hypothetical protein [Acidobacteriota bacterium]